MPRFHQPAKMNTSKLNFGMLFFPSMLEKTELYLSNEFKSAVKSKKHQNKFLAKKDSDISSKLTRKSSSNRTIENEIDDAIKKINKLEDHLIESSLKKEERTLASTIAEYTSQAKDFFSEVKSGLKSFYESNINYSKSIYKSNKQKKKIDPDCWQIGIDVSRTCNFIFFPKKMKKIMGIMIDKGIMLDYINPSPVLCYFYIFFNFICIFMR